MDKEINHELMENPEKILDEFDSFVSEIEEVDQYQDDKDELIKMRQFLEKSVIKIKKTMKMIEIFKKELDELKKIQEKKKDNS